MHYINCHILTIMNVGSRKPGANLIPIAKLLVYRVPFFTALEIFSMTGNIPRMSSAPMFAFKVLCQNFVNIVRIKIVVHSCDSIIFCLH